MKDSRTLPGYKEDQCRKRAIILQYKMENIRGLGKEVARKSSMAEKLLPEAKQKLLAVVESWRQNHKL